jgi:MauM/NapG family ferredoxin protein
MHGRRFFRPPGALHEDEFVTTCSKCLKCVEACPVHVIHAAGKGEGAPEGTPVLRPNHGACTLCGDCMEVCPTGALKPTPVGEIRIGIAVIQPDTCLGYQNKSCRACHNACPLEPNAIDFEGTVPKVDSRVCTGCGLCVHACPTKPPSVLVLPRPARPAKKSA